MLESLFEQYQIGALPYGALFIIMYIFASPLCNKSKRLTVLNRPSDGIFRRVEVLIIKFFSGKELYVCLLASVASQVTGFTPLARFIMSDSAGNLFLVYSGIYFTAIRFLTDYKIMKWCFIMAVFELIVYKAYRDEIGIVFIEAFLYENYELLVTLLHMAIINSAINWRKVIGSVRDYCLPLLRTIRNVSLSLPY